MSQLRAQAITTITTIHQFEASQDIPSSSCVIFSKICWLRFLTEWIRTDQNDPQTNEKMTTPSVLEHATLYIFEVPVLGCAFHVFIQIEET